MKKKLNIYSNNNIIFKYYNEPNFSQLVTEELVLGNVYTIASLSLNNVKFLQRNKDYYISGIGINTTTQGVINENDYNSLIQKTDIKEINIPETITSIGEDAFKDCTNLTSINFIGESKVESIGANAFLNTGISEINIPETITEISEGAFKDCTNLTSINFIGEVKIESIGDNAFLNTGISSLRTLPSRHIINLGLNILAR